MVVSSQDFTCPEIDSLQQVFIVGSPKSGTTMLLALLDGHPNTVTFLEASHFHLNHQARTREELLKFLADRYEGLISAHQIHEAVTSEKLMHQLELTLDLENGIPLSKQVLSALTHIALSSMSPEASRRVTHVIEKTPRHYDALDRIFIDFPNAKVIHLLRDPRDNYLALKRWIESYHARMQYHPVAFILDRLIASLEAAARHVNQHDDHYRIMFYEDLVVGGEDAIRRITEWLDLPWDPILVKPTTAGRPWKGNSGDPQLKDQLQPFDMRPLGKWKRNLSSREIHIMEEVIHRYHLESKYPLTGRHNSWQLLGNLLLPFDGEFYVKQEALINRAMRVILALEWYLIYRYRIYAHLGRREHEGSASSLISAAEWVGQSLPM